MVERPFLLLYHFFCRSNSCFRHALNCVASTFQRSSTKGKFSNVLSVPGEMYPLLRCLPYQTAELRSINVKSRRTRIILTYIFTPCWSSRYSIRASFDTITKSKGVVVLTYNLASIALYGFDGTFGCSWRGDVDGRFEVLSALQCCWVRSCRLWNQLCENIHLPGS